MATTTPNFGWSVPTSSDLVKNGATAIETLGDSIDASLVDLKGGTSGQVLKKNSNTDMDFVWSADSAGMTNPMTTTGDTIYSSSGSTPARLGIGSTGQVLTVAAGIPSWATPSSGGSSFVGVRATKSVTQAVSNTTLTTITWDGETYDTDSIHDNSTNNSRFTVPTGKTGYWHLDCNLSTSGTTGGSSIRITKNGTTIMEGEDQVAISGMYVQQRIQGNFYLTAADYLEIKVFQFTGASLNILGQATGDGVSSVNFNFLGA